MENVGEAEIAVEREDEDIPTAAAAADSARHSSDLRCILAQCFATYVNSLSYMSLGLMYTIASVVVPEVKNAKSGLSLDDEQVSWYVALLPVFQPVGCVLGGFLQNYIGRKQGLLLMNVSTVTAWLLLYRASSVEMLYASSILMGVSIGFAEAPSVTYVCEITTPKLRGTLVTYNNCNVIFGIMLTFLLAHFMQWRTLCLLSMGFCVVSVLFLFFIPDSPVWLINKGRAEEALRALQWLRGWVSETEVIPEFEKLRHAITRSDDKNLSGSLPSRVRRTRNESKLDSFLEAATLRPFVFLCLYMFFAYTAAIQPARNYYIDIFNRLNLNVDSTWLNFLNSFASLFGSLMCAATVKVAGKRFISLTSMLSSSLVSILLGVYIAVGYKLQMPSIFVALFVVLGFTLGFGIGTIPWVILGEIYPIKTSSMATGITGAVYYVSLSVLIKTYYYLELLLTTQGVFMLYGSLGIIGFFYLWMFMPETEGKTMAEIEELFEDDARRLCSHFRRVKK